MRFATVEVVRDHNLNLLGHRALLGVGPALTGKSRCYRLRLANHECSPHRRARQPDSAASLRPLGVQAELVADTCATVCGVECVAAEGIANLAEAFPLCLA